MFVAPRSAYRRRGLRRGRPSRPRIVGTASGNGTSGDVMSVPAGKRDGEWGSVGSTRRHVDRATGRRVLDVLQEGPRDQEVPVHVDGEVVAPHLRRCVLEVRVRISRPVPDGSRIRRGTETCRSRPCLVRVGTPAPWKAKRPCREQLVRSARLHRPRDRRRARGTRRPQGRPPHQDPGLGIAVRPPRSLDQDVFFCRRTVS